jgi:hypothetical protein
VQERRQIYTRSWNEYLKEETSLERPRLRWEDNIIMDLKKRQKDLHWIHLAEDRKNIPALLNKVIRLRVSQSVRNVITN